MGKYLHLYDPLGQLGSSLGVPFFNFILSYSLSNVLSSLLWQAFGSSLSINDANDLFPQFSKTYYNFNLQEVSGLEMFN